MDLGTSITASVAIIMAGIALMKFFGQRKKPNNNGNKDFLKQKDIKDFVPRQEIMQTFREKMKDVVYEDTCTANIKSFETQLALIQTHLSEKIDGVLREVRDIKKRI